jgi:hypothetical protein
MGCFVWDRDFHSEQIFESEFAMQIIFDSNLPITVVLAVFEGKMIGMIKQEKLVNWRQK